jgi:hypothetical protein
LPLVASSCSAHLRPSQHLASPFVVELSPAASRLCFGRARSVPLPLPGGFSHHVSDRAAVAAASPTASAIDRVPGTVASSLPGTTDISTQAPRSATSPTQDRCPRTAASTPSPIVAHSSQRLQSEHSLLPLRRFLPVDVCSFPITACLSHGNEEHVGSIQPAAMDSQRASRRPVCSSYCCTGRRPHS